jgi:hypothetical protein
MMGRLYASPRNLRAAAILLLLTGCTNTRDLGSIPDGGGSGAAGAGGASAGAAGRGGDGGASGVGGAGAAGTAGGIAGDGGGGTGGSTGVAGSSVGGATGSAGSGGTAAGGGPGGQGGSAGAAPGGATGAAGTTQAGGTAGGGRGGGTAGTGGGTAGRGGVTGTGGISGAGGSATGGAGAGGTGVAAGWTYRARTPETMTPWPTEITGTAAAYDSKRKRVVLYGGTHSNRQVPPVVTVSRSLWYWDGLTGKWDEVTPPPNTVWPTERTLMRMAYDPGRDRIVLWGGQGGGAETWEWDGVQWTEWPPGPQGPTATYLHAMTYDAVRGRVVLFDRYALYDWDPDAHRWVRASAPMGAAISNARIVYDSLRSKIVLYGGYLDAAGGSTTPADLFDWDPTQGWLDRTPSPMPATWPVNRANVVVYDTRRHRMVIYGGTTTAGVPDPGLVWEWDGARNSWTRRDDVAIGPPANITGAVYDPDRDKVVAHMGFYTQFEMKDGMWEFTSP